MAFSARITTDLIQIAAAGGGFRLEAAVRLITDLIQIAVAAKKRIHGDLFEHICTSYH